MIRAEEELRALRYFSRGVKAESARNLKLLRAIDGTITGLAHLGAKLNADAKYADEFAEQIADLSDVIDRKGDLLEKFEKAQIAVHDLYIKLIQKRKAAQKDSRLTFEDGIESAYNEVIASAADLHNSLNDLRWAIAEHDADLSPVSKPYTDIEELLVDLES